VWGGGWLAKLGVMDFAGGLVVHLTAGVSAIVLAVQLGRRRGFPNEVIAPHSPGMTMMGAGMLWVGWYGFNAGSALAANGSAAMAMTVTHISAAAGALTWMATEWLKHGKPSLIGISTGAVAGLATITPGSGFVGPGAALVFGVLAGIVCYRATPIIKQKLKIDDSLDVMAVHGVGGTLGVLLTGVFVAASFGGVGLPEGVSTGGQVGVQALGVAATALWSVALTYIIAKVVEATVGLRVSHEEEVEGLDITSHGERAYDL
jgi:Amt family ammonium transporter